MILKVINHKEKIMTDNLSDMVGILYGVESISLAFVKKSSSASRPYEVKNVILSDDVRKTYVDKMCSSYVASIKKVSLSEYKIDKYNRNNEVLWIDAERVYNLHSVIHALNQNSIDYFKIKELGNGFSPNFFGIKMTSFLDGEQKEIYLFNSQNPSTDLKKKTIMYWQDDKFEVSEQSFSLRHDIDCIYDVTTNKVYIFNRRNFENIFNYNDYYIRKAKECLNDIKTQNIFTNFDMFNSKCLDNTHLVDKLAKMKLCDELIDYNQNLTQIKQVMEEDNNSITFDGNNKIVIDNRTNSDYIKDILSILNDEYLKSRITEKKYISSTKQAQQLPFTFAV